MLGSGILAWESSREEAEQFRWKNADKLSEDRVSSTVTGIFSEFSIVNDKCYSVSEFKLGE